MAKTYAEIKAQIAQLLQDIAMATFLTAELDLLIPKGIAEVSRFVPRATKETLTTTASSRELTLSSENKRQLLWIDGKEGAEELEYKVDLNPPSYHHFIRRGDTVTMLIDALPSAVENVYLYLAKKHILQKEVGASELTGTIKTEAAAGASLIVVTSLGTGTVKEDTQVAIADDTTTYTVTADAPISGTDATLYITPVTSKIEAVGKVVTLSLAPSTLDLDLEECLADYVAAMAAISKAAYGIDKVNIGGGNVPRGYESWGTNKLGLTLRRLQSLATPLKARVLPRGS